MYVSLELQHSLLFIHWQSPSKNREDRRLLSQKVEPDLHFVPLEFWAPVSDTSIVARISRNLDLGLRKGRRSKRPPKKNPTHQNRSSDTYVSIYSKNPGYMTNLFENYYVEDLNCRRAWNRNGKPARQRINSPWGYGRAQWVSIWRGLPWRSDKFLPSVNMKPEGVTVQPGGSGGLAGFT